MKKYRTRVFLNLNKDRALKARCSDDEITELENILVKQKNPLNLYYLTGIPPELFVLTGTLGEKAYLEKGQTQKVYRHGKLAYKKHYDQIVTKYPSTFTVREMRQWNSCASNFFKPLIEKEIEMPDNEENFEIIIKRPYVEQKVESYNPTTKRLTKISRIRVRKLSDKTPHGTNSVLPEFYKKRNSWLKTNYRKLKRQGLSESECYIKLEEMLSKLPSRYFVSSYKPDSRKLFKISFSTIKNIVQSKKI